MADYAVTIDGASQVLEGFNLREAINAVAVLQTAVRSEDGLYRPEEDMEIYVTEDGTHIFGGVIISTAEKGLIDRAGHPAIVTSITAHDFSVYETRKYFNGTLPAGTVKSMLTILAGAGYLGEYGITLDGTMADGPSLPAITADFQRLDDLIKTIMTMAQWVREYSYTKVLRAFAPGTVAAPWNIAEGTGRTAGDVLVTPTLADYANKVYVRFTEVARAAYAFFNITGNFTDTHTVTLGSRTYTFQAVLTDSNGHVLLGATIQASLENLIAAVTRGAGNGTLYAEATTVHEAVTTYFFRSSTDVLTVAALTPGASGNSINVATTNINASWTTEGGGTTTSLLLGADAAVTNTVSAQNAAEITLRKTWEVVIEAADITLVAAAQALADAYVAAKSIVVRHVKYVTYGLGLRPGQVQTIVVTYRNLNNPCLLTEIVTTAAGSDILQRAVNAVVSLTLPSSWRDTYNAWGGSNTSGAVSFSGGYSPGSPATLVSKTVYFLGSVGNIWTQSADPDWVPADGPNAGGGIEVVIDTSVRGTRTGTVTVQLRAMSGNVHAGLWDIDNAVLVGQTITPVSTSDPTAPVTFNVTLTEGRWRYRLVLLPSLANVDVAGIGFLE